MIDQWNLRHWAGAVVVVWYLDLRLGAYSH